MFLPALPPVLCTLHVYEFFQSNLLARSPEWVYVFEDNDHSNDAFQIIKANHFYHIQSAYPRSALAERHRHWAAPMPAHQ
jgi:hypothetical protein